MNICGKEGKLMNLISSRRKFEVKVTNLVTAQPFQIIQDYLGLSRTIQDYPGLSRTIQDYPDFNPCKSKR
jgi:hypothetical protein